jgi:hypothetical protein
MLFFSYFAKKIYTLSKNLSSNFNLLFFWLEKGGRQRKGERELGGVEFGEQEFNKKECLLLI